MDTGLKDIAYIKMGTKFCLILVYSVVGILHLTASKMPNLEKKEAPLSRIAFGSCANQSEPQNGSLEDQLHGRFLQPLGKFNIAWPPHGSALTWFLHMKIALDSTRGLEHLHEHYNPAVIHRDFKSSNILLDANFNAKVQGFV